MPGTSSEHQYNAVDPVHPGRFECRRSAKRTHRALPSRGLAFCDERGYRETLPWTVSGFDTARALCQSEGFEIAEEYYGEQQGIRILEQNFVRPRGA